jgi:hypothetical protein
MVESYGNETLSLADFPGDDFAIAFRRTFAGNAERLPVVGGEVFR